MALTSLECKDVTLYLTEYSRGQLSQLDNKEIEEHLKDCRECRRENEILKDLSIKIDKLIPVVDKLYEKDFIYRLFINSKPEPIFFKIISLLIIASLFIFIFSAAFYKTNNLASINYLKYRAEHMFQEDYYSNHQAE
ncbi:MAG: zf-HC2 domain-containing protein [Candidatus Sericytochromatia bacterium]|nr:zf-HC2 domain-containing protein [Candidatus Sericytochromatia bacterium]